MLRRASGVAYEMIGFAPAENGDDIVHGSGWPCIDVTGFVDKVSWLTFQSADSARDR